MRPVEAIQVDLQLVAPPTVEVDDRPHVHALHQLEQGSHIGSEPVAGEPPARVMVRVDGREPRARYLLPIHAKHGPSGEIAKTEVSQPRVGAARHLVRPP